ncbi:MAG: helix-turn-helix domain-containing protein [Hyphomicrobiales bacterium]|nr:MAG: helix-turn-helix domain-containing protein [Hyphomicrobiales bacterium]
MIQNGSPFLRWRGAAPNLGQSVGAVFVAGNTNSWIGKRPARKAWTELSHELERDPSSLVAVTNSSCNMPTPHWHAQVEINFIYSGSMTYRMAGHMVDLAQGDIAMFWGGQPHQAISLAENTELVAIHLPLVHFFRLRLPANLMHRLTRGATLVTSSTGSSDTETFRRLTDYMRGDDRNRREHAIDELLLRLNRVNYEAFRLVDSEDQPDLGGEPTDAASFRNVIDICAYITENFRDNIGSADIASSVDIHPKYAMSVFKKSTGMTLNEYITLLRLSYAQSLLLEDDLTILDVAMESGFVSLSTFNQSFRKFTGKTPSDFRRQNALALIDI